MKNKLLTVLCISCLLLCMLTFSACQLHGTVGLMNAEINEDGELILIYEDGSEQNLGVVVGNDGQDGKDGQDGEEMTVRITVTVE